MNKFGELVRADRERRMDPGRGRALTQERLGELIGKELGGSGYSGAAISDRERGVSRIHKDHRRVLTSLIKVFYSCGGIESLAVANELLKAGNYRQLSSEEIEHISVEWCTAQQNLHGLIPSFEYRGEQKLNERMIAFSEKVYKLATTYSNDRLAARNKRNREIILKKVKLFWVEGVLENSLRGAALHNLGMEYKPKMVEHPWDMILQRPHRDDHMLPEGTKKLLTYMT
jgi:hypothetical protein